MRLIKLNSDVEQAVASRSEFKDPTMILFHGGREVARTSVRCLRPRLCDGCATTCRSTRVGPSIGITADDS